MKIYVKNLFPYFFCLIFNHDVVICIDFTHVEASNTSADDVTNYVTHRVFNANL